MLTLAGILIFSFVRVPQKEVHAQETVVSNTENSCERISDEFAAEIFKVIDRNIRQRYGENYAFENCNIIFEEADSASDAYIINVDVYVDMILTADPMESDYVRGMQAAVKAIENDDERKLAELILQNNVDDLMKNYNQPQRTAFTYQVRINDNVSGEAVIDEAEFFYRTDIVEGETLLTEMPFQAKPPVPLSEEEGCELIWSSLLQAYSVSEVTYDRGAAVAYALEHATDEPYFSKANGQSDCANFVSQCLHAGGIPIDIENEWYPSPREGAYAGRNWMRTGFTEDSADHIHWGVVPYVTHPDRDYFSYVSTARPVLGSIFYWNNTSHVAMVTYVDQTGVVKYSEHSNVKRENAQYLYDPNVQSVTLYIPNI